MKTNALLFFFATAFGTVGCFQSESTSKSSPIAGPASRTPASSRHTLTPDGVTNNRLDQGALYDFASVQKTMQSFGLSGRQLALADIDPKVAAEMAQTLGTNVANVTFVEYDPNAGPGLNLVSGSTRREHDGVRRVPGELDISEYVEMQEIQPKPAMPVPSSAAKMESEVRSDEAAATGPTPVRARTQRAKSEARSDDDDARSDRTEVGSSDHEDCVVRIFTLAVPAPSPLQQVAVKPTLGQRFLAAVVKAVESGVSPQYRQ